MAAWMRPPPGAPNTMWARLSFSTIVGEMVEFLMRHGWRPVALAPPRLKSAPESLSRNPDTVAPAPNVVLLVCVSATAFPSPSTTDMCVVSPPDEPSDGSGSDPSKFPLDVVLVAPYGLNGAHPGDGAAGLFSMTVSGRPICGVARPAPTSERRLPAKVFETTPAAGTFAQLGSLLNRVSLLATRIADATTSNASADCVG